MIVKSKDMEERAIEQIADLICVAARTAPKGRGVDNLVVMAVKAGTKDKLAAEMRSIAKTTGAQFFERDANCAENTAHKGLCAISIGDLGIALGSAVSVAAQYRVDNRIMFSIGKAALNIGLFEENVKIAYGIPLSISGKSPFFDRG